MRSPGLTLGVGCLLAFPSIVSAQVCPNTNYTLTTQAQVDAFPTGCSEVSGDLVIEGSGITNLDGLSALNSLGRLFLSNSALTSLNGLSALTSVGGDLYVDDNDALTNLDGLSGLTSVGLRVRISNHDALMNLDGLDGLTSVPFVEILNNDALMNLNGLSGLTSVGNFLEIEDNDALTSFDGLSALTSVFGLDIFQNDALTSISGLSGLRSAGFLTIEGNTALTGLDGLSGLTSVGFTIQIEGNAALTSLDGLSGLTSVGETLEIWNNDALTDLDGLFSLTSVGLHLEVWDNNALTACSCGLYSLISGGGVTGSITMHTNAASGDCNNNGADLVAGQCSSVGIEDEQELDIPVEFSLHGNFPNPFKLATTISYDLPRAADATLTFYDMLGREIRVLASGTKPAGTYEVSFDADGLPSGAYFCRLAAGDFVVTKRMVIVK